MVDCYPVSAVPGTTRLFRDYLSQPEPPASIRDFFAGAPFHTSWVSAPSHLSIEGREAIANLLLQQNRSYQAGDAALANIEGLRAGANAVVTGQQVALFGGPLFTLLKAATAIRQAQKATASGHPTVPIFWLATEDHDIAEVTHVTFPGKHQLHRLRMEGFSGSVPVGERLLGDAIVPLLREAESLLGAGPLMDILQRAYRPENTFAGAFAAFISAVFSDFGLIVIDAATRPFHALASELLRAAILQADELNRALLKRSEELEQLGYHAQVLVAESSSVLFLIAEDGERVPLRRRGAKEGQSGEATWKAGSQTYSTDQLLAILDASPERLSPNALLRPVFQDAILPTLAYIGGPAEIAYFAQSAVLYERLLGRKTPILPRLSATLLAPAAEQTMHHFELQLPDVLQPADALAQRLAARAIPIEGKRRLEEAGNTLDMELTSLLKWTDSMDPGLNRAAETAASKMRYQMNRMRRLSARHMLEREKSLARHAQTLSMSVFPDQHLQERVLGSAFFLSQHFATLPEVLVEHAALECPGHRVITL